jgi:predicted RNA-binding Zn-ribbon protein involved in translation (DUF1610 family)
VSPRGPRGSVFRCPVCGAEVGVLARRMGRFAPRCCNRDMAPLERRLVLYVCPVCGSEVTLVRQAGGVFTPRCCNRFMVREAA